MNMKRKYWPIIRTLLIVFHLLAIFVMSFPAPAGVSNRKLWKDPSVVNELHQWAQGFRSIGVRINDDEFEDLMWLLSKKYMLIRKKILKPFKPYMKWSGAEQSWRMFSAPHRYPVRLKIDIKEEGHWKTVYQMRSDEYSWRRSFFDHHRIRRLLFLFGWKKHSSSYRRFRMWVAKEAAKDFPDASHIRFIQEKYRSLAPAEKRKIKQAIKFSHLPEKVLSLKKYKKSPSEL